MILSKLRLFPGPKQRGQVLATLRSVLGPTQAERSCLGAHLYEEVGSEAAILFVEEWESESEFREHVRSAIYRRVLAAIDMSQSAPETCYYQVSAVQGLELIEQIRNSPHDECSLQEVRSNNKKTVNTETTEASQAEHKQSPATRVTIKPNEEIT